MRFIASGSRHSSSSFAAMLSAFSSISTPLTLSVTSSAAQLPATSTLPSAHAAASRTTRPFVSKVDGNRNMSARQYHARMRLRSWIGGEKNTLSLSPSFSVSATISSLSLPPPTNTMRKSCPLSRSFAIPSSIILMPLYHIILPTNRNTGTFFGRS